MTPTTACIAQINVNPQGGVPKGRIEATNLTSGGVAGDYQRDKRNHGGPTRAVSLFSKELIETLQSEGHPIIPGSAGENLTISGLDWAALQIGDRLQIGETVVLEITSYTAPCENIAKSFSAGEFTRISQKVHPGWSRLYARVLVEGTVREGDSVKAIAH